MIVFGVVDDSRIRSKTAPFSFENGLVWTGPQTAERGADNAKVVRSTLARTMAIHFCCVAFFLVVVVSCGFVT